MYLRVWFKINIYENYLFLMKEQTYYQGIKEKYFLKKEMKDSVKK